MEGEVNNCFLSAERPLRILATAFLNNFTNKRGCRITVFAAISAFFLTGEILTPKGLFGAGLVLMGMLIADFTESKNEIPSK